MASNVCLLVNVVMDMRYAAEMVTLRDTPARLQCTVQLKESVSLQNGTVLQIYKILTNE